VKYGQFVEPGQTLTVTAEIVGQDEHETRLKAMGRVDGQMTVSARLVLRRYNLADADPSRVQTDRALVEHLRNEFQLLCPPALATAADKQPTQS
jgi:3-hydroxyacyl-[acyl-carrier-protein] dehydratase